MRSNASAMAGGRTSGSVGRSGVMVGCRPKVPAPAFTAYGLRTGTVIVGTHTAQGGDALAQGHKVTMLGTGLIGLFYTQTLHGQRNRDAVQVVYSRSEERARQAAADWGVPEWT